MMPNSALPSSQSRIAVPDIPGPMAKPSKPDHTLPAGSCDAHAHIFGPADRYPYSATREYTPPDASRQQYANLLHHLGFERAVLVQPSVYGTDNRLLVDALRAAAEDDLGITWRGVAVVNANASDRELEELDQLGVRGVRLNLVFKGADLDFDGVVQLARRIEPLHWHLQFLIDILTFTHFAQKLSMLPVPSVVDHMGHFRVTLGSSAPAFRDLLSLVRDGKTWVKLSGPNRISSCLASPLTDVTPLAKALIEAAPDQLVFGTDWPHVRLPTAIPDDGTLVDELFDWVDGSATLVQSILVDNPKRLYGL